MKKIAVIHLNEGIRNETVHILGHDVEIEYAGCGGDSDKAALLIREYDGKVDAIGLEGMPAVLKLGTHSRPHDIGSLARFLEERIQLLRHSLLLLRPWHGRLHVRCSTYCIAKSRRTRQQRLRDQCGDK